jgi:hypothetical protein
MIAIISDIHDNLTNLDKFLKYAKENKISEVICLGDVANDDTIKKLADNFKGSIHLVRGNMDSFDEDYATTFSQIKYYGEVGELELNGKKIVFTHKLETIQTLTEQQKHDYFFYGHTHKPWQKKKGKTILLNPGTVAGTFSKATFAIWDSKADEFQLILLDEL